MNVISGCVDVWRVGGRDWYGELGGVLEIVPPYLRLVFDGRLDCAVSGIVAGPDLLIVTPFEDQ